MTWIYLFLWIEKMINMRTKQIHYLYRWLFHLHTYVREGEKQSETKCENLLESKSTSFSFSTVYLFTLFTASLKCYSDTMSSWNSNPYDPTDLIFTKTQKFFPVSTGMLV